MRRPNISTLINKLCEFYDLGEVDNWTRTMTHYKIPYGNSLQWLYDNTYIDWVNTGDIPNMNSYLLNYLIKMSKLQDFHLGD